MLVKLYGTPLTLSPQERRYSPAVCVASRRTTICGNPDPDHVSTSYAERQNLTMRMSMRRFTRLTNAFSKKLRNHEHAISLHCLYYNFCRVHQTLKTTPAIAAGVTDKRWTVGDLVGLLEHEEKLRAKGGRINRGDRS